MHRFLPVLALICALLLPAMAEARDFGGFRKDELSAPKSVGKVKDPTGNAPTGSVIAFSIPPGYCNPKPYEPGGKESDCTYNSTRAQMVEGGKSQPKEAWYGWWVYFPKDFRYGSRQVKGHYEFAYWHNHQCPHLTFFSENSDTLYLGTNRALGNYECEPDQRLPVVRFSELLGRWTQFEVHVIWSSGAAGRAEVYVNGDLRTSLSGATLTKGLENINYFKYGIYLCCTADAATIRGTQLMFTGVKRADSREGLALR